ncbi:hypothetical protein JTE90_013682, partial [Oedothorax gibbosus]
MPKKTAHVFEDKWRSDDVKQQEAADFSSLLLSERVLLGLKKAGFKKPSPIQLEAIPVGRVGNDLIVQAKSGTGKTLVFTIIALDLLMEKKHPQTLILAPTREIAFQICEVIKSVSSTFKYLKCGAFIGGIPIEEDRQNILGCQIVVGTPGRIKQLIQLRILQTAHIRILVLDEADQLLEKSFQSDIDAIFVSLPSEKQIITTSATYPKSLKKLVVRYLKPNPYIARLNINDRALLGTRHYIQIVDVNPMPVLAYRAKMRALENVLTNANFSQCLIFCNAVSKVEPICDDIKSWGFSATYISSAKEQTARLKAIECLKRFKCKVLVSSDVTSRGIDAENVDLIVNVDVPYSPEIYLHRVGRAGRFGSKGLAVTFVPKDQISLFKNIQKNGNFKSYFLPDPVPGNLIDLNPDQETEFLKEDSISESSDEELIPMEKKSRTSMKIMDNVDHMSNDKSLALNEDKIIQKNSLNSKLNDIEKESFNNIEVISRSALSEDSCNRNLVTLNESAITYNELNSQSKSITIEEDLNCLVDGKINDLIDNKENIDSQAVDRSLESIKDETSLQLPIHKKDKFSFELGSSSSESKEYLEIADESNNSPKDMDISTDSKSSCFSESKESLKVIDGPHICQNVSDSNEGAVLPAKSCDSDKNSEASIDISPKEDSTDKIFDIVDDIEGLESIVKDEPTILPDREEDALSSPASISDKDKLVSNVYLNSNLDKVEKSKRKAVEPSLTCNTATSSSQIDEVTACVINFIHDYETKSESALNDDAKSPTEKSALERKSLNDYYYNVFDTYRKDNITGDVIEMLDLIKDSPNISTVKEDIIQNSLAKENVEKFTNGETKKSFAKENYEKHSIVEAKMDLNTWSLTLSSEKLSEVDSDSTDSSSESVLESTPIKAQKIKSASLDVSCDTPSFPIPVDESDDTSDASSSSAYSNKCQATLGNSCKNKTEVAMSSVNSSEQNSVTSSDSESSSSSDSEDSSETTLLEKANRKMLKNACGKLTLVERANMLREVLHDLGKEGNDLEESDIQITTAGHSQKVPSIAIGRSPKIISNGNSDRQCGFLDMFEGNEKSSNTNNLSRFENLSDAKKLSKADYPSTTGSNSGKSNKTSKRQLHRISSTSEASIISETSSSSASLQGKGKFSYNNNSYLKLEKLSESMRFAKADGSAVKNCSKNIRASQRKLSQISSSSESLSEDETESSVSMSSHAKSSVKLRRSRISSSSETSLEDSASSISHASNYSDKQKRSRNVHCKAKNTSEYNGSGFTCDNQHNQSTHQWNPRMHENNFYFNPQGEEARGSCHTHKHNDSCYLPSQHRCHTLNSHSACQSCLCAT